MEIKSYGTLLKEEYMRDMITARDPELIVVAVKLPNGATEVITNTSHIIEKCEYYRDAYDEEFRLRTNRDISVIGYMIV